MRDVIIAGGGMVGGTLACALGTSGFRVAVIEPREPKPFVVDSDYDLRVCAVSPGSGLILRALDAWPIVERCRCYPYQEMRVWDAGGSGEIHFDAREVGEPWLGYIIENHVIQQALVTRAQALETVKWVFGNAVEAFHVGSEGVSVSLDSGEELEARLLVGADGQSSKVREWASIEFVEQSYDQAAVVANVHTELPAQRTAWQRFLPTGPLAFLPLAEHQCAIVWSTASAQAKRLLELSDEAFCNELATAFDYRLGGIEGTSARAMFPLRGGQASPYVRPRVALVGDAAHLIHPLAGQGVNLGFMDAAVLAQVVCEARRDIASLRVLRRYERARKADNVAMMRIMEGFKWLFGNSLAPVAWLRNIGLTLTDAAYPIKGQIMRYAMDIAGERPRLARGLPLERAAG